MSNYCSNTCFWNAQPAPKPPEQPSEVQKPTPDPAITLLTALYDRATAELAETRAQYLELADAANNVALCRWWNRGKYSRELRDLMIKHLNSCPKE